MPSPLSSSILSTTQPSDIWLSATLSITLTHLNVLTFLAVTTLFFFNHDSSVILCVESLHNSFQP